MSTKTSRRILVGVRVCPCEQGHSHLWRVIDKQSIQGRGSLNETQVFDHAFDERATNQEVFDKMAQSIVGSFMRGMNGTIFAYGQNASGKTYTMEGDSLNPGVMALAAKEIFQQILQQMDRTILLRVGYFEIYNDKMFDLLDKTKDVKIQETSSGVVTMECESIVASENELLQLITTGSKQRRVDGRSSRSHGIFRIIMESRRCEGIADEAVRQSTLNLVDLAGYEKEQVGATKKRQIERESINNSLLSLENVMKKLSDLESKQKTSSMPSFRDSKLTRILQESLCGNVVTSFIGTINPSVANETQTTIELAKKAITISTRPTFNNVSFNDTELKRIEDEIGHLKKQLIEEKRKKDNQSRISNLEQSIEQKSSKIIFTNSLIEKHQQKRRRSSWPVQNRVPIPEDTPLPRLTKPSQVQKPKPPAPSRIPFRRHSTVIYSRNNLASSGTKDAVQKPSKVEDKKAKNQTRDAVHKPSEVDNQKSKSKPKEAGQERKQIPSKVEKRMKNVVLNDEVPKPSEGEDANKEHKDAVQIPSKVEESNDAVAKPSDDSDALLAEINTLAVTKEEFNLRIQRLHDQFTTLQETIDMLRTQISEKDSSIESLLSLKRISCDVLRDSQEEELRSVCPDLQSSCESICNNCQDLERLLPPADDKDMEAILCVCDKLRDEIAATRSQLESVQSAYDQSSCETTEQSDFEQLEQLQGQYDSLENQWISQQGDWGLVYEIREDYEKIQTKYQLLQNYVEANASGKQSPKLEAENAEILNEIATFKQRWENTKLQIDQSSSYESLTKAENGELKEQLAKTQTENHSLSTQVKENDRLQKLLEQNSNCDLKLEEAEIAKNQHSRCKFFELADKILQINLHTDSDSYLFTSTKLKGSQSTDLLRLKLYLDSAKFIEDQSCVQDSTAATVLNGLIQQQKYNLIRLANKEIEEETKEERRLLNKVSKLLNKLISKDELLAETSKKLNNLRKEFRTVSNNAMTSRQKIESQISQILEKDKYIEKLKTEIEELSSSASNLEKLNNVLIDRVTNVGKSLAESQRSFNVLQSKEDQSRKLLGEVQEELQKTKVELSTKTEEVEALTAGYKTELETERDALRNKICELEEENRSIVSSHQNELEEFKKDLCEKLEQAQADYLDAVEVRNKLKEAEAERADLLVRMNEMNSSLEDMVSQRDSERVRVLELEKSKAELELSLKRLTMEKHELDISNKKSLDLVKDLQLQLKKLGDSKDGQEIIALQSRIKEEKAAHSITGKNYSKLKAQHEDLVAKKDSEKIALQEHADTLAAKVVDLKKELLKANELLSTQEGLKSSLSDAKNLCTERNVQIEYLKNQLNLADGEVLKQTREKEKLRKDLDLALEEKESAVAKKEDIEMQLADLKDRMSSQALKQEKQILNLNGSIRELQLKIKFLNERKEKLEADIEKNSQYSQNLEVQLREKQKALAASCESYSKLHNDLKAMIIEHAKTNYGLKVDIDLAKQNLLKMTEERDAFQAKLETKANCEIKMKEQILKLEKKLETNKARDKTHRQAIVQATKEIEQLRNEKKKLQQDNIQKNLLISNLENKLTILNTTNKSLQPLRTTNESKFLTERNSRDQTISVLLNNNPNMGEKMCTLTDKVEKLKRVLPVAPGNGSERNSETETETVRRNRRIMDYDNNRRQSGWSNLPDSETMTDTADMNGNGDERVSEGDHPFNSVALCLPRLPHSENGNQGTGNGK